ncbi:MAG: hypothetical protein QP763_02480 [Peptoniphilus duerdenii]|uniref:hypothetical protein n=1 Tax=Peptoniphilus duerdenii TaxID=507750 RepID=UPI00254FDB96|nr:hypothetical protein [Peptoniphilus duerdenii]MDK8275919.1 hypothetical protein [Peptoniphilus duerdenii]
MKTTYKVLLVISAILLIGSSVAYYLSTNSKSTYNKLVEENKELEIKLNEKQSQNEEISQDILKLNENLEVSSKDFKTKYGYDYFESENMLTNRIKELEEKNKNIESQVVSEVLKFERYFKSGIYSDEKLESKISDFIDVSDIKTEQISKDLYGVLNLNPFVDKYSKDGFINYILKRNPNIDSSKLKLELFNLVIYSRNLNEIIETKELPKNLNSLRSDLFSFYSLLKEMEKSGISTGELNSKSMDSLNSKITNLISDYFINKGQIEVINLGGTNEK